MAGQFTCQGDNRIFTDFLTTYTLVAHLFTNSTDPGKDSPSFTECSATGYSSQTLSGVGSWTAADITTAETFTYSTNITFSFTSATTIYGYWIRESSTNIWYEIFAGGPFTFTSSGGSVIINPIVMTVT